MASYTVFPIVAIILIFIQVKQVWVNVKKTNKKY